MATAKEAGFVPGDIAIVATAWKNLPPIRGGLPGIQSGIPLDTPGATVDFTVYRVLALDVPQGADLGTKLEVLIDHSTFLDEQKNPGNVTIIHGRFKNFILEGDIRLRQEMQNAGLQIQGYTDTDGKIGLEITKDETK